MKRLAKIAFLLVSILAALSAVIIGITQTDAFRGWLRNAIVHAASANLNGTLTFGDLHGNLITGVRIDSASITLDGVTMLHCNAIVARYNPLRLPSNYISLAEVTIADPQLMLTRGAHDSLWNIERLTKPQPPGGPFNWTIDARDFELQHASVDVVDSSAVATTPQQLSFARVALRDINLSLACKITRLVQDITINHFSFSEPVTGFRLRELAGNIYHAADTTRLSLARVVTGRAGFSLYAGVGRIDTTTKDSGLAKFAHVPVSISLNADSISFDEAKIFSPAFASFAKTAGVNLSASGTLAKLDVKHFGVKVDHSFFASSGVITHLDDPPHIAGDVQIFKSVILPSEIFSRMPGIALPDLSRLGTVTIAQMSLKGNLKTFASKFSVGTGAGSATGTASIDLADSIPKINADVTTGSLNLTSIVPSMPSSGINGRVQLNGSGSAPQNFNGSVALELTASSVSGRSIDRASVRAGVKGCDIAIDTLFTALADSGGTLALHGTVQTCNGVNYDLHLLTEGLNIASVTQDAKRTRLNTRIDVHGHGVALDSMVLDTLFVHTSESELYGRQIPPFHAALSMLRPAPHEVITTLVSDLGVVKISGNYRIDQVIDRIVGLGNDIAILVSTKIVPAFHAGPQPAPDTVLQPPPPFVDAAFHIVVTNPALISAFLETKLGGRTVINGTVHADSLGARQTLNASFGGFMMKNDSFDLQLGKTTITEDFSRTFTLIAKEFYDTTVIKNTRTKNISSSVRIEKRIGHVDEKINLVCASDSLRVNDLRITAPSARFSLDGDDGQFGATAAIPGQRRVGFAAGGALRLSPGTIAMRLDTARFEFGDNVKWREHHSGDITFNRGAIALRDVAFTGDSSIVQCSGTFEQGTFHAMRIGVQNVKLSDVNKYASIDLFNGLTGTVDSIVATIDGTSDDPHIDVPVLRGSKITFRGNNFGRLDARLHDAGKVLQGEIHLGDPAYNASAAPDSAVHRLDADVRAFPFDCAFSNVAHRIPDGGLTDVRTRLTAFPITFLEIIFGATVDQLRGFATGKIAIAGNTPSVRYNGSLNVSNARFRTLSTNIVYSAHADILFYNDTLEITSAELANLKDDAADSWARIWGYLYFRGLNFNSFDLYCDADQVMVLSRASRHPNSFVYGPLVISTRPRTEALVSIVPNPAEALHFYGSIDQPNLEGTLYTENSDLKFPQTNGANDGNAFSVVYDLSQKYLSDSTVSKQEGTLASLANAISTTSGGSLLDHMRYNLKIKTEDDLKMTMDFSNTEQLKDLRLAGELIYIRGDDGRSHISGPLHINGGTYYFYDAFTIDSRSSITYLDSIENPSLNITASTQPRNHALANGTSEYIQVVVDITGTKNTPIVTVHLMRGPFSSGLVEDTRNPDKNRADAILFLMTQQLSDDFNQAGSGIGGAAGSAAVTQGFTTLSNVLGSMLEQSGLPVNLSLQYDKDHPNNSRVNVSKQVGKLLVSAGAHELETGNSALNGLEASVSFNLGDVMQIVFLQQTHIQVQRSSVSTTGTATQSSVISGRVGLMDVLDLAGKGLAEWWRRIGALF